jgi:hypothetical protein
MAENEIEVGFLPITGVEDVAGAAVVLVSGSS